MDAGGAWALLGISTVQALFYLGFVLLPAGIFAVGVSEYNLLHAGYLAFLIVHFLKSTSRLEPSIESAIVPSAQVPFHLLNLILEWTMLENIREHGVLFLASWHKGRREPFHCFLCI